MFPFMPNMGQLTPAMQAQMGMAQFMPPMGMGMMQPMMGMGMHMNGMGGMGGLGTPSAAMPHGIPHTVTQHTTPANTQAPPVVTGPPQAKITFPDDDRKVSTNYKALGMCWLHGDRATPVKFRSSVCASCDPGEFSMVRVSQLDAEDIDLLLFILTGVGPDTKPHSLGSSTKGEVRLSLMLIYETKLRKSPNRLKMISDELDNLLVVGMRMGYRFQWLSNKYKEMVRMMQAGAGLHAIAPRNPAALEDASDDAQPALADARPLAIEDRPAVMEPSTPSPTSTPKAKRSRRNAAPSPPPSLTSDSSVSLVIPPMSFSDRPASSKPIVAETPAAEEQEDESFQILGDDGSRIKVKSLANYFRPPKRAKTEPVSEPSSASSDVTTQQQQEAMKLAMRDEETD